jgi:hypothetical protein
VAHTKSAAAQAKSTIICDYVAPRFRERATPESIISTICAPHSDRNCRRSAKGHNFLGNYVGFDFFKYREEPRATFAVKFAGIGIVINKEIEARD